MLHVSDASPEPTAEPDAFHFSSNVLFLDELAATFDGDCAVKNIATDRSHVAPPLHGRCDGRLL